MDYAKEMLHEQRDSESKARAAEIVARVRALHVDEMTVGTKVSFVKRFDGVMTYTYLALKASADRWYVTGRSGGMTDERFEDLLAESLGFDSFELLFPSPALRAVPNYVSPVAKGQLWEGWPGPKPVRPTHEDIPVDTGEEWESES